jgi:phospholipase/lecithinase/hemolysin
MASTASLLLLLLAFVLGVWSPGVAAAAASPFRTVYAFGDSFTDTGNTHSTTGPYSFGYVSSPPYGATFFHRSTNRYSDGRLVVDFLAQQLNLPAFIPPYLAAGSNNSNDEVGVNFAVAGSTAIEHDFFAKNNMSMDITPQSIMTQLGWFDAHLRRTASGNNKGGKVADALFWVGEIGANDYAYSVLAPPSIRPKLIRTMAVQRVTTFVEVNHVAPLLSLALSGLTTNHIAE